MNCETDFVARGDVFKQLANDLAMQVAACPQVTVVDTADVPTSVVEKERSIQMGKEDILTKPEAIRLVHLGCLMLMLAAVPAMRIACIMTAHGELHHWSSLQLVMTPSTNMQFMLTWLLLCSTS